MNRSFVWGVVAGLGGYWAIQHFTGYGTSGLGAHRHPGGLAA